MIAIIAFTRKGAALASRLAGELGNSAAFAPPLFAGGNAEPLTGSVFRWAGEWFPKAEALVFVSAAGIAVRAIAPHVRNKTTDPAVIVLDDAGRNVISLLSGHIGGGNALAREIAALTGGRAIITTATDTNGVEAPDEWAVKNNCAIENPEAIKTLSAAMLENVQFGVAVTDDLPPPPWPVTLWLRPKKLVLGIGCRRGVTKEALDAAVKDFLSGAGKSPLSLKIAASIYLKRDEPAIVDFCRENRLLFVTYEASELRRAEGSFSSSLRVMEATGVDNVCERAAVLAANNGPLLRSKTIYPGIALALARET